MMLLKELNDPRLTGLPSITRVVVSDDLATADIFMSVMGTPGQQTAAINALRHSAGMMRTLLGKSLSIRTVPFLQFQLDEQMKKELETLELIEKAIQEARELEAKRTGTGNEIPEPTNQKEEGAGG